MTEACNERIDDIVDALSGRLPADRRVELDAHLASCEGCAREAQELGAVSSLLQRTDVDLDAIERPDEPPADLGSRITAAVESARNEEIGDEVPPAVSLDAARERRATRPGRARGFRRAAAGVAAAILVGFAAVSLFGGSGPSGEVVALAPKEIAAGASAKAELHPQSFGTAIDLEVTGLDQGRVYALWLADASGERTPAGTFVPGGDGKASLATNSALPRDKAVRIWITDSSNATVLAAPLT